MGWTVNPWRQCSSAKQRLCARLDPHATPGSACLSWRTRWALPVVPKPPISVSPLFPPSPSLSSSPPPSPHLSLFPIARVCIHEGRKGKGKDGVPHSAAHVPARGLSMCNKLALPFQCLPCRFTVYSLLATYPVLHLKRSRYLTFTSHLCK